MPKRPAVFSLKEIASIFQETYDGVYPVSADLFPLSAPPRWITWSIDGGEVSLHIEEASKASRMRIARLFSLK